jgi:hypothetical protein
MPTARKEILKRFKPHGPDAIHRLLSVNVLRALESDLLIPEVVAFHLCGWTDARHKARSSFEMVVPVLQHIYETIHEGVVLTTEILQSDMEKHWPNVNDPLVMWLGLYQCYQMGLVGGWAWDKQKVQPFRINEGIMAIDAPDCSKQELHEFIGEEDRWLQSCFHCLGEGHHRGICPELDSLWLSVADQEMLKDMGIKVTRSGYEQIVANHRY